MISRCLLCFSARRFASHGGRPRTGPQVQANPTILACAVEIGQTEKAEGTPEPLTSEIPGHGRHFGTLPAVRGLLSCFPPCLPFSARVLRQGSVAPWIALCDNAPAQFVEAPKCDKSLIWRCLQHC